MVGEALGIIPDIDARAADRRRAADATARATPRSAILRALAEARRPVVLASTRSTR